MFADPLNIQERMSQGAKGGKRGGKKESPKKSPTDNLADTFGGAEHNTALYGYENPSKNLSSSTSLSGRTRPGGRGVSVADSAFGTFSYTPDLQPMGGGTGVATNTYHGRPSNNSDLRDSFGIRNDGFVPGRAVGSMNNTNNNFVNSNDGFSKTGGASSGSTTAKPKENPYPSYATYQSMQQPSVQYSKAPDNTNHASTGNNGVNTNQSKGFLSWISEGFGDAAKCCGYRDRNEPQYIDQIVAPAPMKVLKNPTVTPPGSKTDLKDQAKDYSSGGLLKNSMKNLNENINHYAGQKPIFESWDDDDSDFGVTTQNNNAYNNAYNSYNGPSSNIRGGSTSDINRNILNNQKKFGNMDNTIASIESSLHITPANQHDSVIPKPLPHLDDTFMPGRNTMPGVKKKETLLPYPGESGNSNPLSANTNLAFGKESTIPKTNANMHNSDIYFTFPGWTTSKAQNRGEKLEVLVEDEDDGTSLWCTGTAKQKVVGADGKDAFLLVEYDWYGESYEQDFEPQKCRQRGSKMNLWEEFWKKR